MFALTDDEQHYEKYIIVALELLTSNDGPNPSSRALVDRLGGSLTTANKAMKVFWRYVSRKLSYEEQYPEGMPLEVIKLMEKVMANSREAAKNELDAERIKLEEHEKEIEASKAILEQSVERLSEELNQEKNQSEILNNHLDSINQKLSVEKNKNNDLVRENEQLTTQLSALKNKNDNLVSELDEASNTILNLKSELKSKEDRVVQSELENKMLTERVSNHEKRDVENKQEIEKNWQNINSLQNRNQSLQDELNEKNIDLAKKEVELSGLEKNRSKLESELDIHIKRNSGLEDKVTDLASELAELRALKPALDDSKMRVRDLQEEKHRLIQLLEALKKSDKPDQDDNEKV